MEDSEIPPFFICPISLQIMEDPVTICTGITYDRESIRQWLFVYNKSTCPVTKQLITDRSFTPNSTLLRLMNSWRAANTTRKTDDDDPVEGIVDARGIKKLVEEAKNPETQTEALKKIKSVLCMDQNGSNKRMLMEELDLVELLSTIVINNCPELGIENRFETEFATGEEALIVLSLLRLTPETAAYLASLDFITCLSWVLQRGSYKARLHSMVILKSICKSVPESFFIHLKTELFDGIVEILKDQNSNRATMAALSVLTSVCSLGKNRLKAVEAGAISAIVEFLVESSERRKCEMMLGVVELLCGIAEGREAFLAHPASVAVVTRKIFRVSNGANEKAVRILWIVCKHSSSPNLVREMVDAGSVLKLFMILQMGCNSRTIRDKAKAILCLNWKSWESSSCIPRHGWTPSSGFHAVG